MLRCLFSSLYARPDNAIKARIEQLLDAAAFVPAYRLGAANLLLAIHAAGLDVAGLTRVATIGMLPLTSENEAAARHAIIAGDLGLLPASTTTFDLDVDYFQVLLLTHARGSFAGLYYLPLEFNGNVDKLQTVWLQTWPHPLPLDSGFEMVNYVA